MGFLCQPVILLGGAHTVSTLSNTHSPTSTAPAFIDGGIPHKRQPPPTLTALTHTHTQQETLFDGNSIRAIAKHGPKTANKSSSLFVYITNCEKPYLQRLYSPSISDRAVALLLCVVTATLFHFVLAACLLPASLPFMFYYVLVLAKENFNLMVLPMSLLEWRFWGWRMSTAGNEYTVRLSNWR